MGDAECFEKELQELNQLLRNADSIKIIKNLKYLVKDYIEETNKERAISKS